MLVRVFFGDQCKDVIVGSTKRFTIGSSTKDDLFIDCLGLKKGHVKLLNSGDKWTIDCNGTVHKQGGSVTKDILQYGAIYLLSDEYKVAMICLDDTVIQSKVISVEKIEKLTIGRSKESNVYIPNSLISKSHATVKHVGTDYYLLDENSANGTYLNGARIDESKLNEMDTIVMGNVKVVFHGSSLEFLFSGNDLLLHNINMEKTNLSEDIKFERSPRLKLKIPTGVIEIEAPPSVTNKPELNIMSIIMPTITTIVTSVVMTAFTGRTTMMLYSLPMNLIGLVISFVNYRKQKKKYHKQNGLRLDKYTEHLENVVHIIEKKQREQREAMASADPDLSMCFSMARTVDRKLWERKPVDSDYMSVRIGTGEVESSFKINIPKDALSLEEDELRSRPKEIYKKYRYLNNAPITCDILNQQVCGVVGTQNDSFALLKNIIAQISTHHCYTEVKTIVVYNEQNSEQFAWVKRLPHALDDERTGAFVATSKAEANSIFDNVLDELKMRKTAAEEEKSFGKATIHVPYYLFVIAEPEFLERNNPITQYLLMERGLNAGIILAVENIAQLPKECNLIIEVEKGQGKKYQRENASMSQTFTLDYANDSDFIGFSENLSHIICDEQIAKATIPSKYSFYEMFKVNNADELDVGYYWGNNDVTKSISALIGITERKEISLDLHEKAHGPHGLVAGTTGSGKSELLQSYILSLALNYSPHDVGFVIIDFKGGGMANQFASLPHLIGTITNIEGNAINRSLASIKAELLKRQRLFAEYNVNNIDRYIEQYHSGLTAECIPHLIIVVDEFAELKAEQPEFMKELISVARIGRSLGIHLILATQKPAGQVSDQIWSNSKFKICLKVSTREDSNEVIKSTAAFNIKEPGRAYLQVGNNEIFELFQSGYSGVMVDEKRTQLDAVISRIVQYCEINNISKLPSICCDELPEIVVCPSENQADSFGEVMLGILDAPQSQYQGMTTINIAKNNTLIVGSPQMGKTNIIQSIISQCTRVYSPEEMSFYIIDMGAMALKIFENLHHVGGIVTALEQEKLKNLFKLLSVEIENRKNLFLEKGVSSFGAYQECRDKTIPLIVVCLDNLSIFKDVFDDEYEDFLVRFLREGITYGITFVITNPQTSGISYKYLSSISTRIALACNDSTEYSFLFDRCRLEPADIPGRALVSFEKNIYEVQTYLAFPGENEALRAGYIRSFVQELNEKYPNIRSKRIPAVPRELSRSYIELNYPELNVASVIPIAIDFSTVDIISLNCNSQFMLTLAGKNTTAKSKFIDAVIADLEKNYFMRPVDLYIVDKFDRPLAKHKEIPFLKKYSVATDALGEMLYDVHQELSKRLEMLEDSDVTSMDKVPWIVVLINNKHAIDSLADDNNAQGFFEEIHKKYSELKVLFVISDVEDSSIRSTAPLMYRKIRDDKKILYFGSLKEIKIVDVYGASTRSIGELGSEDEAYFINGEGVLRVKTIQEV